MGKAQERHARIGIGFLSRREGYEKGSEWVVDWSISIGEFFNCLHIGSAGG
jgi:hypothetical protein